MSTAALGRPSGPASSMVWEAVDGYRGWILLAAGILLTVLTGLRWNVALLAWVAPVPFMLYLRDHGHWRGRGTLLLFSWPSTSSGRR